MAEPKLIVEIPKCRQCGCEETLTQKAWKVHYGEPPDVFVSFRKEAIPLTKSTAMTLPMVPGLLVERDFCAECGFERVIRARVSMIANPAMLVTGKQSRQ